MVKRATWFPSSPVKCTHLSSSRGTKNCAAGFRQAVQATSLFYSSFLNGISSSPKSPCSSSTCWKPSEQPPAIHMHAPEACTSSCTHWAPHSWLPAWLGEHKTPRDASGHGVKQVSPAHPKDPLKRGQWENRVPSLILSFLPRQTRKPEKINKER